MRYVLTMELEIDKNPDELMVGLTPFMVEDFKNVYNAFESLLNVKIISSSFPMLFEAEDYYRRYRGYHKND